MKRVRVALLPWLAAMSFVLPTASFAQGNAKLEEVMSHDGLVKISVKGVDLAYVRPGAQLSTYKRVMIDPVQVAFSKSWDPKPPGSAISISQADRERIREGVAKIVQEEFARELQANHYPVVTVAGEDVLRVRPNIVNLYISAPDTGVGRSRSFVVSAGEMTLFAELIDSESGQVQARVIDREEARSTGRMRLSNEVFNTGEAAATAALWAKTLRVAMDRARGVGAK